MSHASQAAKTPPSVRLPSAERSSSVLRVFPWSPSGVFALCLGAFAAYAFVEAYFLVESVRALSGVATGDPMAAARIGELALTQGWIARHHDTLQRGLLACGALSFMLWFKVAFDAAVYRGMSFRHSRNGTLISCLVPIWNLMRPLLGFSELYAVVRAARAGTEPTRGHHLLPYAMWLLFLSGLITYGMAKIFFAKRITDSGGDIAVAAAGVGRLVGPLSVGAGLQIVGIALTMIYLVRANLAIRGLPRPQG